MAKKTNYSYVGVVFIILVFGIIFIPKIIDRVGSGDITRADESRSNNASNAKKNTLSDLEFININGVPKKVPAFSFTNQDGQLITEHSYLGKVYVVEFFFTTCPTICPRMNRNLIQIQKTFENNKNFGVASFTITPEIDIPQVLKAYANTYGVTNPNWHLMTGDKTAILNLANVGFMIYAGEDTDAEGGMAHSGNFALIDKNGFIRSRKDAFGNPKIFYKGIVSEAEQVEDGETEEISILKEDIAKLLKE